MRTALQSGGGIGVTIFATVLLSALAFPLVSPAADSEKVPQKTVEALREQVNEIFQEFRVGDFSQKQEKVIYGEDDRLDVYQVTDSNLLHLAQAACVVVFTGEIQNNGDGTYTLLTAPWVSYQGNPLCEDEPFRGQQTLGFCSGYLVGEDIVITAGHCVGFNGVASCGTTAFVFNFEQVDESTPPPSVVPEDQVYFCSEIISTQLGDGHDYSVVRLDRPVQDRIPLDIRREGSVALGDPLVVVGHPVTLPKKIAGGAVVKDPNGTSPWFAANLDTYAGNSGSLVANLIDHRVEGILVRGQSDFTTSGSCARSRVCPDTGCPDFEEVTKTTSFSQYVPLLALSTGRISLNRSHYPCGGTLEVKVLDADLVGLATIEVTVTTLAGDSETVLLMETEGGVGCFEGSVSIGVSGSAVSVGNGFLQGSEMDTITAAYQDADTGGGIPGSATAAAVLDCLPPTISGVWVENTGPPTATISFQVNETTSGRVAFGSSCNALNQSAQSQTLSDQSHTVMLSGLSPCQSCFFRVEATDLAGNTTIDDAMGSCYPFTAGELETILREDFEESPVGWSHSAEGGVDNWAIREVVDASGVNHVYSYEPGQNSTDARLISPSIQSGNTLRFSHTYSLESGYDYGILEISVDDRENWMTLAPFITSGGFYAGDSGWSGGIFSTLTEVEVDISSFSKPCRIGFRFSSDGSVLSGGWRIDDFRIENPVPCITNAGVLSFRSGIYACGQELELEVKDANGLLADMVVSVSTDLGDTETVYLTETGFPGLFEGTLEIASIGVPLISGATVTVGDGILQGSLSDTITGTYLDSDNGSGGTTVSIATTDLDCEAPTITGFEIAYVGATDVVVVFETDSPVTAQVRASQVCGGTAEIMETSTGRSHDVLLSGFFPLTTYFLWVEATDTAGNTTIEDNGGACFRIDTTGLTDNSRADIDGDGCVTLEDLLILLENWETCLE